MFTKALLADDNLIVGSCNWTVSSRANSEIGVLIKVHPGSLGLVQSVFDDRFAGGELLDVVLSRPRSRSASAHRYGGTSSDA